MGFRERLVAPFRGGYKKAVSRMTFSEPQTQTWAFLPRTNRNYAREVGDGLANSIVVAVVSWAARNFPEAPVDVLQRTPPDTGFERVLDHPILTLLDSPNPYYSGVTLWMATVADWNIHGNAYWIKVRNKIGDVIQLWYTPQHLMEPVGTDTEFITHYVYSPAANKKYNIDPEDVVHFRYMFDKDNPRKGFSVFTSLLREIYTDDEAANYSASILTNLGVPGIILSPQNLVGAFSTIEADSDRIKNEFKARFTGDRRGDPLILTAPTDVKVLTWNPSELALKELRRLPEERIAAVIGIPPSVVGLGAGLENSNRSNFRDAREAAYENNIIPTQRMFAAELKKQLMKDFILDNDELMHYKIIFDTSNVKALNQDQLNIYQKLKIGVGSGVMTVAEARTSVGLPVNETHDIYLRAPSMVVVPIESGNDPNFMGNRLLDLNLPPGTTNSSVTEGDTSLYDQDLLPLPFGDLGHEQQNPRD